jgi:hypothetical protein
MGKAAAAAEDVGLPRRLAAGIEGLSGISIDDVRVHRNAPAPDGLPASAFGDGADIHLPQDQHSAHEAWHAVEQKQGRVKPTARNRGAAAVDDGAALEKEADRLGRGRV